MWEFVDQCVYEHTGECIITINGALQCRSQMPCLKHNGILVPVRTSFGQCVGLVIKRTMYQDRLMWIC